MATDNAPAVLQFPGGIVYPVYCRRCGQPVAPGDAHQAGPDPVLSGHNCGGCVTHVLAGYRWPKHRE